MITQHSSFDPQTQAGSEQVDLSRLYPISRRIVIKKCLLYIIAPVLAILALSGSISNQSLENTTLLGPTTYVYLAVVALLLGASVCKIIYELLYREAYYYGIQNGQLVIANGLLLRKRGAFSLALITDIYVQRNFLDLIFGLHTLHISTPTIESGNFARIYGLSRLNAFALQNLLSKYARTHRVLEANNSIPRLVQKPLSPKSISSSGNVNVSSPDTSSGLSESRL